MTSAFGIEHVGKADKREVAGYSAAGALAGGGAAGLNRGRDHARAANYYSHTAAKLRAVHPTDRIYELPRVSELQGRSAHLRRLSLRATRGGKAAVAAGVLTAGATAVAARNRKAVAKSAFGVEHIAKYGAVQAAGAVGDPAAAVRDKKKLLVARPVVVAPGPSATQKIKAKLAPIGSSAPDLMD